MEISEVSNNNWLSIFDIIHFDEQNIKNPISEQEKKEKWVPDEKANYCFNCNKEFSALFQRKHHCRICGNIFCKDCANQNINLKLKQNNICIKVCDNCFETYNKFTSLMEDNLTPHKDSKNNIEMKLSLFCKTFDFYQDEVKRFSGMDLEEEKKLKIKINESFDILLKILVFNVLNQNLGFEKSKEWTSIIYLLVKESIIYLRPSSRYLNDSLEINDYIKIKIIEADNKKKSQVIQGYAFQKNVANKKMKIDIDNPTILLLDPTDFKKNEDLNEKKLSVQKAYLKIIKNKIQNLNPNVILFSENFPQSEIDNFLSDNNISIVFNVKKKALNNLARCTQTILLPSLNLIGKKILLGKCKKFKVLKFKKITNQNSDNTNLQSNDYNLMIFDGCDRRLYSSILLCGEKLEDLKILKNLLKKTILPTARDLYLQKFLIYFFNHQAPEPNLLPNINLLEPNKSTGLLFLDKMFNLKEEIGNMNNEISTNNSHSLKKKESNAIYIQGFDVALIDKDSFTNNLEIVKLTMSRDSFIKTHSHEQIQNNNNEIIKLADEGIIKLENKIGRESDIQKKVATICERSKSIVLQYYSKDKLYDKPLGQFILDLCQQSTKQCDNCHKTFAQHVYYLYRNKRRIKISMILEEKECEIDKVFKYINDFSGGKFSVQKFDSEEDIYNLINSEIYTYGFCKICNNIVTPLNRLPNEIFNYSSTKFFKDIFKNHITINFSEREKFNIKETFQIGDCRHLIYTDIKRVFVTKFGSWQFEYETIPKYFIIPMNLNSLVNNSFSEENLLDKYITHAFDTSTGIISIFKNYLNVELNEIIRIKDLKEMNIFSNVCEYLIDVIHSISKKLVYFSDNMINKYLVKGQFKYDSYVKAIIYIKRIYLNIIQMKVICNKFESLIDDLGIVYNILIGEISSQFDENSIKRKRKNSQEISNTDNNRILNENLNSNDLYKEVLKWLNFYDNKHNLYSCEVNDMDLSSLIAYALTSDDYYTFLKNGKLQLNELKCERNSRELIKDIIYKNIAQRRISKQINISNLLSKFKKGKTDKKANVDKVSEEEVIFDTLLLFDQSKQNFIEMENPNSTNTKILQQLETELLNDNREKFHFFVKNQLENYFFPDEIQKKTIPNIKNHRISFQKKIKKKAKTMDETKSIKFQNNNNFLVFEEFSMELKKINEKIEKAILEFNNVKNHYINILKLENEKNKESQKLIPDFDKICNSNRKEYIENTMEIGSDSAEYELVAYFPRQFEALRIAYCATFNEFIISMSKSYEWQNVSGGKSKATFSKSIDQKYILKYVSKSEFKMFIDNCNQYFHHNAKYLFHKMPSALAKILGAYKIKFKKAKESKIDKYYILLMENLYYGMKTYKNDTKSTNKRKIKIYDLKGSKLNRYIPKIEQIQGKVLLDTNYLEDYNGEPIAVDMNVYKVFRSAIHNDSLVLTKMNVIDYSLLLILDETEKDNNGLSLIKLGIIDYTRKYTWDKQLESFGKILMNGISVKPTIINPEAYRTRFMKEIEKYLIGV